MGVGANGVEAGNAGVEQAGKAPLQVAQKLKNQKLTPIYTMVVKYKDQLSG